MISFHSHFNPLFFFSVRDLSRINEKTKIKPKILLREAYAPKWAVRVSVMMTFPNSRRIMFGVCGEKEEERCKEIVRFFDFVCLKTEMFGWCLAAFSFFQFFFLS